MDCLKCDLEILALGDKGRYFFLCLISKKCGKNFLPIFLFNVCECLFGLIIMSNTLMFGLGQLPDNYGKVYGLFNDEWHIMSTVLVTILSRF